MQNLKPVYDAAVAADAKVNAIMADMLAAFEEGTEEGRHKALGLRAALDEAKAEAKAANELYVSMRDAQASSDEHARRFVPASEDAQPGGAKQITRADYEVLNLVDRANFIRSGGIVKD